MTSELTITGDYIIEKALQKIGAIEIGEVLPDDILTDCRLSLNMLIKNMQSGPNSILGGEKVWQRQRSTLTLSAKATFEIKASGGDLNSDVPIKMISVALKDTDGNETQLRKMTLNEYESIPNRTTVSTPSAWFYERKIGTGYLYFDCIPSDITYVANLTFLASLENIDDPIDNIEFPAEYFRLIVNALAIDIAPEFGLEPPASVTSAASTAIKLANSFEPEQTDAFFQPEL